MTTGCGRAADGVRGACGNDGLGMKTENMICKKEFIFSLRFYSIYIFKFQMSALLCESAVRNNAYQSRENVSWYI